MQAVVEEDIAAWIEDVALWVEEAGIWTEEAQIENHNSLKIWTDDSSYGSAS